MPSNPAGRARDAYEKAKAAAAPKIARAQAEAAPHAEKAVKRAGSLLGQVKDQARKTAKNFGEGYGGDSDKPATAKSDDPAAPDTDQSRRPKPGPH